MSDKVWFVTGASRGFCRIWAQGALARGDEVVATARSVESFSDLAKKYRDSVMPLALVVGGWPRRSRRALLPAPFRQSRRHGSARRVVTLEELKHG